MTLLRMDEVGEFQRIAHEEDGRVVAHQIPVAFVGIEFQRKAPHVAFMVRRAHFPCDGRKACQHRGCLPDRAKDRGTAVSADVLRDGEGAKAAPAFGMDHAFRDPFAVLMRQLFQQLVILHQHRAAVACGLGGLVRRDRCACRCRHPRVAGGILAHDPAPCLACLFLAQGRNNEKLDNTIL